MHDDSAELLAHLIAVKRATPREKDQIDVLALARIRAERNRKETRE
jgi:hypothetical protein